MLCLQPKSEEDDDTEEDDDMEVDDDTEEDDEVVDGDGGLKGLMIALGLMEDLVDSARNVRKLIREAEENKEEGNEEEEDEWNMFYSRNITNS